MVAHHENAGKKASGDSIEEDTEKKPFRGVVPKGFSVGSGFSFLFDFPKFRKALEGHKKGPVHPVGDEKGYRRKTVRNQNKPAHHETDGVVYGFGKDIQVRDFLGAERGNIVEHSHDPQGDCGPAKGNIDREGEAYAHTGKKDPFGITQGNIDQTGGYGSEFFFGMIKVKGGIQDFINHIVA